MSYNVETIEEFDKQLKSLVKKYPSLKQEFKDLVTKLGKDPLGIADVALGKDCFKVRLAIASKNKGKSGGARVIYHILVVHKTVTLLNIFDKSDRENIADSELIALLKKLE